jgi:hypothetical protein
MGKAVMKKHTKRVIIIVAAAVISVAAVAVYAFASLVSFFNPAAPQAKEQTISLNSYDGKLTLVEEHRRVNGVMTAYFSIHEGESVIYDCPDSYRIWDYHGTFWSLDCYDFWTLSSDVGMCCYVYDEGTWQKGWQIDCGVDTWTVTIGGTTTTKAIALGAVPPEVIAYVERISKLKTGGPS